MRKLLHARCADRNLNNIGLDVSYHYSLRNRVDTDSPYLFCPVYSTIYVEQESRRQCCVISALYHPVVSDDFSEDA